MQKYIGRQLKTARLNKKLTQEQIAEAVGISAKHSVSYTHLTLPTTSRV
mgnify:CR=1 FL=1